MRITLASCKDMLKKINAITVPHGVTYDMQRIYGSYIIVASDDEQGVEFGDMKVCYYVLVGIYNTLQKYYRG